LKQLGATDRLEQAYKLLHPLSTLAPNNIDVWIATYDVAIRRSKLSLNIHRLFTMFNHDIAGKLLQAVAALSRASALNRDHPDLHIRLIDLKQTGMLVSSHDFSIQLTFTLDSIFTTAVTSRSHWPGFRRCCVQTCTR
jgi:hypothetical protein